MTNVQKRMVKDFTDQLYGMEIIDAAWDSWDAEILHVEATTGECWKLWYDDDLNITWEMK